MFLLPFSSCNRIEFLHYSNPEVITLHLKQNAERDDLSLGLCVVYIAKPRHHLPAKASLILKHLYI